ncbi:MAG: hypothetical protein ACKOQ6_12430 [Bacteroidota bacterium]
MTEKKEISVEEWYEQYLQPFLSDEALQARIDGYGGFDGWVLDGVLSVRDIDGQYATDNECLEMVAILIDEWKEAQKRGFE